MKEQDAELKKANARLAWILGGIAVLLAAWPWFTLREAAGF